MVSTTTVTQGLSPHDDYDLDAIAQHNAVATPEQFPPYEEDVKGPGIYNDSLFQDDGQSYVHSPPTPQTTVSEGVRTRSGRSTRRNDSPFSTSKSQSRVSKSPATKSKKDKKSSKLDRSKTPKLTAPLSVMTKDMDVPLKDMDGWVNRSAETRREEAAKRDGYVTRPVNSFMLYRSCYAERTKQWCLQNNHQVVSSVSGESWPMEPDEVREQFNEWAKIERANHALAHPEYKFSPSKPNSKRKKGDFSDDEAEGSDLDADPDGEYRGGSRSVRQKQMLEQNAPQVAYLPSNVGFESHPYFGQQYDHAQYAYAADGNRAVPANVGYEANGIAYDPQLGTYVHAMYQPPQAQYSYMSSGADTHAGTMRMADPTSLSGAHQTLGGYGMPGGHLTTEELFGESSRTSTPAMQAQYNHFGQPMYPQYYSYTPRPAFQAAPTQQQQQQQSAYEHAQYLQQASQPQTAIDPGLGVALAEQTGGNMVGGNDQSHFDDAMGDFSAGVGNAGMGIEQFFDEPTSPRSMLPQGWAGTEMGAQRF